MISKSSPTASRTAVSRATILLGRPPDLDLRAAEAAFLRPQRVLDQLRRLDMQPAALRRVERHRGLRPARLDMERPARTAAAHVPQRRVDGAERQRGDGAHRRCMGVEEQRAPDRLDAVGVASDQLRREIAHDQLDHRLPARADRVAVTRPHRAVVGEDAHDRRLLAGEGLDRVRPLHLWLQVHHTNFNPLDLRHLNYPSIA